MGTRRQPDVHEVEAQILDALRSADGPVAVTDLEQQFGPLTGQVLHRMRAIVSRSDGMVRLTGSGYGTYATGREMTAPGRGLNPPRVERTSGGRRR